MLDDILSAATTPIAWRRTTISLAIFLARTRRRIGRMVAAAIARRERHAALAALHHLNGHELRDIGIYRSQIDFGLDEAAQVRSRLQHGMKSAGRQRARTELE
jgi:uncharacterized protein YjiS (DUF1127 family)